MLVVAVAITSCSTPGSEGKSCNVDSCKIDSCKIDSCKIDSVMPDSAIIVK